MQHIQLMQIFRYGVSKFVVSNKIGDEQMARDFGQNAAGSVLRCCVIRVLLDDTATAAVGATTSYCLGTFCRLGDEGVSRGQLSGQAIPGDWVARNTGRVGGSCLGPTPDFVVLEYSIPTQDGLWCDL